MSARRHEKIKILFLAANPLNTEALRLDQEARQIRQALGDANIACDTHSAVRTRDIPHALRRFRPNFVHFSGHGEREAGIIVENTTGHADFVPKHVMAELFRIFDGVKCVVFNSCYSREQAEVVAEHVPYVIGMSQEISDDAAIEFAFGFYQAMRDGESVEKAFEYGRLAVAFSYGIAGEFDVPVLFHNGHEYFHPRKPPLTGPSLIPAGSVSKRHEAGAIELSWESFESLSLRVLESIYSDARLEFSRAPRSDQSKDSESTYVVGVDLRDKGGSGGQDSPLARPSKTMRSLGNPFRLWVEVKQRSKSYRVSDQFCRNLVRAVNAEAAKLIFLTDETLPKTVQDEIERFAHRMCLDYCLLDGSKLPRLLKSLDMQSESKAVSTTLAISHLTSQSSPTEEPDEALELSLTCGFTLDPASAGFEGSALSGEPGDPVFVVADVEVLSCTTPTLVTLSASLKEPSLGGLLAYETHDASALRPAILHIPLATGDRRRYTFILFPCRPATISTSDILFNASSGGVTTKIHYVGESSYLIRDVRMSDWIPPSRAILLSSLENELARWQRSSDTASHLLLAPAGTGKSHAVARLRRCWLTRGAIEVSLDGQIHSSDLSVIKRVLVHAFALEPRTLGEDQTEAVANWLAYAGVAQARASEIAEAISNEVGLEAADATLLVDILVALLRRLSAAAPVVLLFEDAHKARPSALVLLREIQRRLSKVRVALFVTSRLEPENSDLNEQKKWHQGLQELLPAFSQTALTVLQHHEGVELIQRTIPSIEAHDAEAILDQVGTSPFGIREAINYLVDYGIAVYDSNLAEYRVERREILRKAVRLEKFTQATQLRLQRLRERSPRWLGSFLEAASLLGRHFPVNPCLRAAEAPSDAEITQYLGECEVLQFLKISYAQPDSCSFDHDLVRTAVLERISAAQQRSLAHKLLPEIDSTDDFVVGSLAYQAGLGEKSVSHLTRYAEQNTARSRHLDAIRALRVAIRIFDPTLPVGRESATVQEFSGVVDQALQQAPLIRMETLTSVERYTKLLHLLRLLIVSLSELAGGGEPTIEPALAESFLLARRIMDEPVLAELEYFEARWLFARGRLNEAVERHQQAEAHYSRLNRLDLLSKRINNLLRLAVSYRQIGDRQRSILLLEQAERMRDPGDLRVKARILAESGALYFYVDTVEVRKYWEETLVAARESEHPGSILHALTDLAQLDVIDNQVQIAQARLQESLRIAEKYGLESEYIRILLLNGCIAIIQGELAAARRDLLEAEAIASRGGNHRRLWRIRANLATVYELSGDLKKAYVRDREVCESVTPLILEALPAVYKGLHLGREFLGIANVGLRAERSELHNVLQSGIEPSILSATDMLLSAVHSRDLASAPNLLGRHCKQLTGGLLRYIITE
jgi:tetratricopeptide (TPR) repeat protein